jgi:hypothetical protein
MRSKVKHLSRALVVACALAPLPALADTPVTDATVEVQHSATAPRTSNSDAQRYADREQQNKDVEKFEGGNIVIISGGAVLVAFILMLLIL